jgi:hypothetical protein
MMGKLDTNYLNEINLNISDLILPSSTIYVMICSFVPHKVFNYEFIQ